MDEKQYQIDLLTAVNKKLSQSDRILKMISESPDNAYVYYNFAENRTDVIGDVVKFTNMDVRDVRNLYELPEKVDDNQAEVLLKTLKAEDDSKTFERCEYCLEKQDWIECNVIIRYDEQGKPAEKLIAFKDISRFNKQNDELIYMAYYDPVTGLFNRNCFVSRLNNWIVNAADHSDIVSIMYINLDDFRKVNYRFGIETGDELVQVFGQYLQSFASDRVMVSHFTGDIFCIGIYDPCGSRSVEHIYNTIHERIAEPFYLTGHKEVKLTLSVGVAEYPEAAHTALELITCGEIVMSLSKKSGKNSIHYYDANMMNRFMQDVTVEEKLKNAIANNSLMLYYQPQYDSETNRLRGCEALLRWRDIDGTMISPSVFIPIAEKSNVILLIGDWVLNEALSTYAKWKKNYDVDMVLSINISSIQYKRQDFVNKVMEMIESYGLDPRDIELEITEGVLIEDFDDVVNKMNILRDYGVKISMDDFGTGFSSLNYLKGLPIDTLKIDKTFIDYVATDSSSQIITKSIVSMVKQLGFETVAEGVETKEQYEYLRDIDCDNIQGFLLGKPMPENKMEELFMKKVNE